MRVVLADLRGVDGFVNKDRVAGGYGNRLRPFSSTTRILVRFKRRAANYPSVQMAYLAAICARAGHDIRYTEDKPVDGDVALVLSSLVDYRNEVAFGDMMRARGVRVGYVGLTASKLPELFKDHADFIVQGEPEEAIARMAAGERLEGICTSQQIDDLDSLPFPRWQLLTGAGGQQLPFGLAGHPRSGGFPVLASRGCSEFCTYCSHIILGGHRVRSVTNIVDEIEYLSERVRRPYIIFRDPLFTDTADRCLALCDEIEARGIRFTFECETRTDRLDVNLLRRLHRAGLRRVSFGVESVSPEVLKKVGRRPTPHGHERTLVDECRRLGIQSVGFFMLGFLTDDWQSIAATIDYACDLSPTVASFKLVTPYPATPMWKQMLPLVTESDMEKFDGFTPTFRHPSLSHAELRFLMATAYSRFYFRPSYVANLLRVQNPGVREWVGRLDRWATERHVRQEVAQYRSVSVC
jgi:radical SAM superfamily enzyme YgiQ (UPF0313 family)